MTAGPEEVPPALVEQLAVGGRTTLASWVEYQPGAADSVEDCQRRVDRAQPAGAIRADGPTAPREARAMMLEEALPGRPGSPVPTAPGHAGPVASRVLDQGTTTVCSGVGGPVPHGFVALTFSV
ncbi:MAG: hypothetical protein OEW19_03635 [Acidobacteriota bacterium]|nr:hypothetical protein [Acidobacteriota bacterium]